MHLAIAEESAIEKPAKAKSPQCELAFFSSSFNILAQLMRRDHPIKSQQGKNRSFRRESYFRKGVINSGISNMLIKKHLALLVAAMVLVVGTQVKGQGPGMAPPGTIASEAIGQGIFNHDSFGASFDPAELDYDFKPFSPLEASEYSGGPKQHSGFFIKYDRTYMNLSRPEAAGNIASTLVPTGSDWVSGNKLRLGYTGDSGNGWELDYQKSAGGFFSNGLTAQTPSVMFTDTEVNRLQLNRVFRTNLSRGGSFEPYMGAGYFAVNDTSTQGGTITLINPVTLLPDTANFRFIQKGANSAAGGQVGARYFRQNGRWSTSSNISLAGFYNSQRAQAQTLARFPTNNSAGGTAPTRGSENTFVPIVNLGMDATYGITRDISLRMGAQLMHSWDGIYRVNTLPAAANPNTAFFGNPGLITMTKENLTLAGLSIGIEWNR